jgi:hypothetical protein
MMARTSGQLSQQNYLSETVKHSRNTTKNFTNLSKVSSLFHLFFGKAQKYSANLQRVTLEVLAVAIIKMVAFWDIAR